MNWDLPCERPLPTFLLCAGVIGVLAAVLYSVLELRRGLEDGATLPTEMTPQPQRLLKVLVLLLLVATIGLGSAGAAMYNAAPGCAITSPIVHTWTLATLLLYGAFSMLVIGVPVLGLIFPLLAVGCAQLASLLMMAATWMRDASKRGALSAASSLTRWLRLEESLQQPPTPTIVNPNSTFGLYVNTAALVWLFGFMVFEARRAWDLACDQPLAEFVLGVGVLGVSLSLMEFIANIFKDPMPPITKLETAAPARDERRRKILAYTWATLLVVGWGALGCLWVNNAKSCAASSPTIYRLALLLSFVYLIAISLAGLIAVGIGIDSCLSGKLRFIVVLEQ